MTITIDYLGLAAITVDAGRRGVQHQGFCQSGPMDSLAFELANRLVGQRNAPTLEVIGDLTLTVTIECSLSVAGPDVCLWVNNEPVEAWQRVEVIAGSSVTIKPARLGSRYYVAVPSGFDITPAVGSACTVKREQIGGIHYDGSGLKAGDKLKVRENPGNKHLSTPSTLPDYLMPTYDLSQPFGIVPGYQHTSFCSLAWQQLVSNDYEITPQMDRMGVRLKGTAIQSQISTLYSEAIALGSMQIPPDGQPIVMMSDRQTLGGYPKVGTLARCDLNRFAQCLPGDKIRFYQLDAANARAQWLLQQSAITRWFGS